MQRRMIRIFVSSTFQDFETERNQLIQEVYGKLETLCRRNGFSFQIIDLRWGVSKEDAAENLSIQICLSEIARCQELSPEVNFLIMVGERYGWIPLPVQISEQEWNILTSDIFRGSKEEQMLSTYYRQDKNNSAQPYCLLPQRMIEEQEIVSDEVIHELLYAQAKKYLEEDKLQKYKQSATEQEIMSGYFGSSAATNTFVMIKTGSEIPPKKKESLELQHCAEALQKKLENSLKQSQKHQLCIYREGDKRYSSDAYSFLKNVIEAQINSYAEMSEFDQEQEVLQNTYRRITKEYVPLPGHQDILATLENTGKSYLLTGESGSGKSWLLKYLAAKLKNEGRIVAAVFNDIQPLGRTLNSALAFLTETLHQEGVLGTGKIPPQDLQHPVAWFENVLQSIRPNRNVTVILDCVDKIYDYKYADQGLFRINIPSNVTVIISAISVKDLHSADIVPEPPKELCLQALSHTGGMDLLQTLLHRHGRRLQLEQEKAVSLCLHRNDTDTIDALAVELLLQICIRLHSWDVFPCRHALNFHTLVQITLFHENRNDYRELRSHALGYLALASVGVTEAEIIDLLSHDETVVREIRTQTPWGFELNLEQDSSVQGQDSSSYKGKIPFVLWAILYAQMRPFLTELMDHGIILLQFRHIRLKEEVLHAIPASVQIELLQVMQQYYRTGEWILNNGKTVQANRRKVCELLPIYELLGDTDSIRQELENPLCVDAYVRCGLRQSIQDYLAHYAVSALSLGMLGQLRKNDLLFQLWPDSFLPAAFSYLKWDRDTAKKQMLQAGYPKLLETEGLTDGEGIFFPQLHSRCHYAMDHRGFVAVQMDGMLRIIDMRRGSFTRAVCPSVREPCFLYWDGFELIVRCEKKRIRYCFHNGQLAEKECKKCENFAKLFDPQSIPEAGGWTEAEYFSSGQDVRERHIRYRKGTEVKRVRLFYPEKQQIKVKLHGTLAAIILDGRRLEVVDLEEETVLQRMDFSAISCVEWASSGLELLVVLLNSTLLRVPVDRTHSIGAMPRPSKNYLTYQVTETLSSVLTDVGRTFHSLALWNADIYSRRSTFSYQTPLMGAMSVRYNRLACYYQTDMGSFVAVYRLTDLKRIFKPMKTDAVCATKALFYPACDRNGFVLCFKRKDMLLDLEKKQWTTAPISACRQPGWEPARYQQLRNEYVDYVSHKMYLQTELPNKKIRFFSPKLRDALRQYQQLLGTEVIGDGKTCWLVDRYHGMIQVFDAEGCCLGRNMVPERILACDYADNKIYLLLEETERIITMSLKDM